MERLMRSVNAGRIVHAYLFAGAAGTGKRHAAEHLTQTLLCTGQEKPCGVCPACKRCIANVHPDVRVISPTGKSISVDEIRSLIDYLSMRPLEGGYHIAVIRKAERLTVQAQNAILKTLEAPVGNAVFILLADKLGAFLPTLLSRVRVVRFSPMSAADCEAELTRRGIEPKRARLLAGLAQGSVGKALEIDANAEYIKLRERVLASLKALDDGEGVTKAVSYLANDKDNALDALDIMELQARDSLAMAEGAQAFTNEGTAYSFGALALLKGVINMRKQLASNVQWAYTLDEMYFSLARQKYLEEQS